MNLSEKQKSLLKQRLKQRLNQKGINQPVVTAQSNDNLLVAPASYAQRAMWMTQSGVSGGSYNIISAMDLHGALNLKALEKSIAFLCERHHVLRSVLREKDGAIEQRVEAIQAIQAISLNPMDYSCETEAQQQMRVKEVIVQETNHFFDLQEYPLFRIQLLKFSATRHVLIFNLHHCISDGWSQGIIASEISGYYGAFCKGNQPNIPQLPLQYADYAISQRENLQPNKIKEHLDYWKEYLTDIPKSHQLPIKKPRSLVNSSDGARLVAKLDNGELNAIKDLASKKQVTLFNLLQTALAATIARFSGVEEQAIGCIHANRNQHNVKGLIGCFVSTMVMRNVFSGNRTFNQVLQDNKAHFNKVISAPDIPFELILETLELQRSKELNPVFQISFVLQNFQTQELKFDEFEAKPLDVGDLLGSRTKFEISLHGSETSDGLELMWEYNRHLFDEHYIAALSTALKALLRKLCLENHSDRALSQLFEVQPENSRSLNIEAIQKAGALRIAQDDSSVVKWFCDFAKANPEHVALVDKHKVLTYLQLDQLTSQFAWHLKQQGAQKGDYVALLAERCWQSVVALIGILKARCAYVPIDSDLPDSRVSMMLADGGVNLLLADADRLSEDRQIGGQLKGFLRIDQNNWEEQLSVYPSELPDADEPWDLMAPFYMIFTSGTTGRPKGVMLNHGNIQQFLKGFTQRHDIIPHLKYGYGNGMATDLGNSILFSSLFCGGELHLYDQTTMFSPELLSERLGDDQIEMMTLTPTHFIGLQEAGKQMLLPKRCLILAGEALSTDLAKSIITEVQNRGLDCQLVNLYGPTETTIGSLTHIFDSSDDFEQVPIGKPLPGVSIKIMDEQGRELPDGAVGELWIGGLVVADGYIGREDLTSEKFVTCRQQRFYNTGDLSHVSGNGLVYFHGRRDKQVKIRGYRIELSEIETLINEFPLVRLGAVVFQENQAQGLLVAYVMGLSDSLNEESSSKTATELDISQLQTALRGKLPHYMVPQHFEVVSHIPRTASGKIDYNALPAVQVQSTEKQQPVGELECFLANVWQEVIGCEAPGRNQNFYSLGGDSMKAIVIAEQCRKLGIMVSVRELFSYPSIAQLAKFIESSPGINNQLNTSSIPLPEPFQLVTSQDKDRFDDEIEDAYPLSSLQEAMTMHHLMSNSKMPLYHQVTRRKLQGDFNLKLFEQSLSFLQARHPLLRTSFSLTGYSQPLQLVHRCVSTPLEYVDLRDLDSAQQATTIDEYVNEMRAKGLVLEQAPLFKWLCIQLGEDNYELVWMNHHGILDGWSIGVLLTELMKSYQTLEMGKTLPEPVSEPGFSQLIARELEIKNAPQDTKAFWSAYLDDFTFCKLPRLPMPVKEVNNSPLLTVPLPQDLKPQLQRVCTELEVPMKAVMFAAYSQVVALFSGQSDITTGYCLHRRSESGGGDKPLGLFVTTLPLRINVADMNWAQLIHASLAEEQKLWLHRFDPLAMVQQQFDNQLFFEISFNYFEYNNEITPENTADQSESSTGQLQLTNSSSVLNFNEFALTVNCVVRQDSGELMLAYNGSELHTSQIQQYGDYLIFALKQICQDYAQPPRIITHKDQQLQLQSFNQTHDDLPYEQCIHDLFLNQVIARPNCVAVTDAQGSMSYQELFLCSHALYLRLIEEHVATEELVAVILPKGRWQVVATLAVMMSGGAYLPIEVSWPASRVEKVLQQGRVKKVICNSDYDSDLPESVFRLIPQAKIAHSMADSDVEQLVKAFENRQRPDHLAYVIFTSGSTGTPKGVAIEHRSAVNTLLDVNQRFSVSQNDRVLAVSALSFDLSVYDIFGLLAAGGEIVMPEPARERDPLHWAELCLRHQITFWDTVPTSVQLLIEAFKPGDSALVPLRVVMMSGDRISPKLPGLIFEAFPEAKAYSFGGATEASIWSISYPIKEDTSHWANVPYGKALANQSFYVLDNEQQLTAIGAAGELYIGGVGVAREYYGDTQRTAASFIFHPGLQQNIYRTGDLGRHLPDGNIEFIGRADNQIKLRGYRVELGEIEACLNSCESVKDAMVILGKGQQGQSQLVGYVVPTIEVGERLSGQELRDYVGSRLPSYMVPAAIVTLPEFPLTNNGKLDRAALPEPDENHYELSQYIAPKTKLQETLCELWQGILGIEKLSIEDNLFALGADSITLLSSVSRAHHLGLTYELADVYQNPTIAKLSLVTRHSGIDTQQHECVSGAQTLLPSMAWFQQLTLSQPSHFNQALLLNTPAQFAHESLVDILTSIFDRHDALRLRFNADNGTAEYQAQDREVVDASISIHDFSHCQSPEDDDNFKQQCQTIQSSLDISNGDLFKVAYFEFATSGKLLLVAHHLAVDVVSWRILMADFATAYEQWLNNRNIELPGKTVSMQKWAAELENWQYSGNFSQQRIFWQQTEANRSAPLHQFLMDTDKEFDFPSNKIGDVEKLNVSLPEPANGKAAQHLMQTYQMSYVEFLVAALVEGVSRWKETNQLTMDFEGHGRENVIEGMDLSETIGWFTAMYPVNFNLPEAQNQDHTELFSSYQDTVLKQVKQQLRSVPDGGIGYGVCRYMAEEKLAQNVPVDILFNYLGKVNTQNHQDVFYPVSEDIGKSIAADSDRGCILLISAITVDENTRITLEYNPLHFQHSEMSKLGRLIQEAAHSLLQNSKHVTAKQWVPQDFPLSKVTSGALQSFAEQHPGLSDLYPLTPVQQGILLHSQLKAGTYINQMQMTLKGQLDQLALKQSWQLLVQKYEVLRTGFVALDSSEPQQLVVNQAELNWHVLDWSDDSEININSRLEKLCKTQLELPFDFASPSLMRLHLVQTAAEEYQLLWTYHHVLLDGWSLPLLLQSLISNYHLLTAGETPPMESAPPFQNYVAWLQKQDLKKAKNWWQKSLQTIDEPSLLTQTVMCLDNEPNITGNAEQQLSLDKTLNQRLTAYCKQQGTTISNLLQVALGYLLQRYLGRQQVVFGITVAGRPADLPMIESSVGLFINTLPVVFDFDLSQSLTETLKQNHQAQLQRTEYSYLSPASLQQCSAVQNGESLFDVLLVVENFPVNEALNDQPEDSSIQITELANRESTNYGLTLVVHESDVINIKFRHQKAQFSDATVEQLISDFQSVLKGIVQASPDLSLRDIRLASQQEKKNVSALIPVSQDHNLSLQFQKVVKQYPEDIAITDGDRQISYAELEAKVAKWASLLAGKEINQKPVALWFERSIELVCAMLAVARCGGFYVPLDPGAPALRNSLILEDIEPVLILCAELPEEFRSSSHCWLSVAELERCPLVNSDSTFTEISPDSPLYVIYTSGTTGKPKGVQVSHYNLIRLLEATEADFGFNHRDVWTLFHSPAFDFSVWEIWGALLFGGRLVVVPAICARDTVSFRQLLLDEKVSVLNQTPSAFARLTEMDLTVQDKLQDLRYVIFGGEAVKPEPLNDWRGKYRDSGPDLINMYGITETTVHVTWHKITDSELDRGRVAIGRPISDLQIRLVNELSQPLPPGCPGEVFVSGGGVALGYVNRPELNAERFVTFEEDASTRWYRSGDLAWQDKNEHFHYMGRADDQVKLRGYRIEPGEIAAVCRDMAQIDNAECLFISESEPQLISFIVSQQSAYEELVKQTWQHLREALPVYMLPSAVIVVPEIPINPNGKVDKAALIAEFKLKQSANKELVNNDAVSDSAFENDTQRLIRDIWSEVLQRQDITKESDFFALGGHSLKLAQVVTRIQQEFATQISFAKLYQNPTIAAQAEAIELAQNSSSVITREEIPRISEEQKRSGVVMSAAQRRIWFSSQSREQNIAYNMPYLLDVEGDLSVEIVQQTVTYLVQRHEVLRTLYAVDDGQPKQYVMADDLFQFQHLFEESELQGWEHILADSNTPFDLSDGPIFRCNVIQLSANRYWLYFNLHHIACDAWSLTTLIREFCAIYNARLNQQESELERLPLQVADIAAWQESEAQVQARLPHKRFWRNYFRQPQTPLPLPYQDIQATDVSGDCVKFTLAPALTEKMVCFNKSHGLTPFMTLFSVYGLLLSKLANTGEVTIGTPVGTRERPEFESLIGFFNNTLAIRLRTEQSLTVEQYLEDNKREILTCFDHQNVPLDEVLDELNLSRSNNSQSLFNVLFVLQNVNVSPFSITGLKTTQKSLPRTGAKFDLTMSMYEAGEQYNGELEFDTRRFSKAQIQQFTRYFVALLEQMLKQPEKPLQALSLMSSDDVGQETVAQYLEEQRTHTLEDKETALDMAELNEMDVEDLERLLSEMD